jgi:5,10-methylenetetrahydromethanopterin reductase
MPNPVSPPFTEAEFSRRRLGVRPSIGLVFPAQAGIELLPAFAEQAESAGFDELWVIEDCFLSGGLVMASAALAATENLRVGVGLMPAPVRNPALAAMELASLARLYPGRLLAAFGHGVRSWMQQIGALPARRLAALGEVTVAVRGLLAGERVTMMGSHVRLTGVTLDRPPEVAPPILIGSTGPKGLALAAREADGFLVPEGCGPAFIASAVRQARDAAGHRTAAHMTVAYAWLHVDDEANAAGLALRPLVEHWLASGLYPEPVRAVGLENGLEPGALTTALLNALAIAGDPGACAAAISRFAEAGTTSVVVAAAAGEFEVQYQRFARDVLPLVQRDTEKVDRMTGAQA